jgi:hypothetical protein
VLAIALLPLLLSQTPPATAMAPAAPPPAETTPVPSAEERAAAAAERATAAAEKAADATLRVVSQLAPSPPPPVCVPAPAPPPPLYDLTLGIGVLSLTGNTESVSANINGAADYRLAEWIFSGKLSGTYGQSRGEPGSPSSVLAEQGLFQLRTDRKLTDLIAIYLLAGADTDHIKSVEYDVYGEAGMSLFWFDLKATDGSVTYLRTDVGFRADQQSRFQYFPTPEALPSVAMLGPHVGVEFRKALTAALLFTEADDVTTNVAGPTRTVLCSVTKLSVRVLGSLAAGGSFTVNYDSAPAAGKLPTDTALALTLDYKI